jgi:Na+-driven multidrug efflux pump
MVIELQNVGFAGRLDNPDALAAVGLANMMINIFGLSFAFGMNTALETLAA